MTEKLILKRSKGLFYLLIIMGLVFQIPLIIYLNTFSDTPYVQLPGLIIFSFFSLFGFVAFYAVLILRAYHVHKHKIVVYNILGRRLKTIFLKEIIKITEKIEKPKRNQKVNTLKIFTNRDFIKIDSYTYPDYHQFKLHILEQTQLPVTKAPKDTKQFIVMGVILLLLGGLFLYLGAPEYLKKEANHYNFGVYKGVLADTIEVRREKNNTYVKLKLQANPYFEFTSKGSIRTSKYDLANLSKIKPFDTIQIAINLNDIDKKINNTLALSFWDKHNGYQSIDFFGLLYQNETYFLSSSDVLKPIEKPKSGLINHITAFISIFSIIGVFFIASGIYLLIDAKKLHPKRNEVFNI